MRPLLRPGAVAILLSLAITATVLGGLVRAPPAGAAVARPGAGGPRAAPAGVTAVAADLVDTTTGAALWSRLLNRRRPIASITKVMTALVVIRAGHLERPIRVTARAVAYARDHDAGSAGLHAGDVLTARQLLEGLLLPSGADAAYALATAYGPGWHAFVAKMNDTARRLGMTGTHFANFDGLPWPAEWSTYATPRALLCPGQGGAAVGGLARHRRPAPPLDRSHAAAPRLRLAEHQPAGRPVPGCDRHQDGVHGRRRLLPAVRGPAGRPAAGRRRARQLGGLARRSLYRGGPDAELGLQPGSPGRRYQRSWTWALIRRS